MEGVSAATANLAELRPGQTERSSPDSSAGLPWGEGEGETQSVFCRLCDGRVRGFGGATGSLSHYPSSFLSALIFQIPLFISEP